MLINVNTYIVMNIVKMHIIYSIIVLFQLPTNKSQYISTTEKELTLIESAKKAEILKNIRYELHTDEDIITGEEDEENVCQVGEI